MSITNERELLPFVPRDHHALFWQRLWDKVRIGEPDKDPRAPDLRPRLTPIEADRLWATRTIEEIEHPSCPWWHWTGAIHRVGSIKRTLHPEQGAVYGYLITHGKGYHTHRLSWSYFNGIDVPHHFRVRREPHCRMFTTGTEFNQLCMWPGCMRLERAGRVPLVTEAYSLRLDDEDLEGSWWRDYELVAGVWQMVGYSRDKPRYVEIEE